MQHFLRETILMPRNDRKPETSRYRSLHASRRALARAAPLVRFGIFSVGVGLFLDQVRPLVSDGQFTWGERRVMGVIGVITLGGYGLAAWVAGSVLKAAADMIEVMADGAEAAIRCGHLVETQLVPALTRAASALENFGAARPISTTSIPNRIVAEIDDLQAKLDASLADDDPDRVIACRDALTQHLSGEPLKELDRRVVRWLSDRVQARVRDGTVTPEVVAFAARAADSFGDTNEGAALLTALPKLRRRAGLCPRCERPYRGRDAACPDCLSEEVSSPPSRPAAGRTSPKGQA